MLRSSYVDGVGTCDTSIPLATKPTRLAISHTPVDLITKEELLDTVFAAAAKKQWFIATYANVHTANLASRLPEFRSFLWNRANVVFCDGFGLLLGAKVLGQTMRPDQRMTAPDFFETMALGCEERGLSMYLLAGEAGVTDRAIARLAEVAPRLQVSGHHGFFQKTGPENEAVLNDIIGKRPDILCIGFGSPLQEKWIADNQARLGDLVCLPLGAWLDFYTGTTWRGPRWLTDHGFEWLCRLYSEPRRLWQRYLIGNPQFVFRVCCARISAEGARLRSTLSGSTQ